MMDLMPTICDFVNVPVRHEIDGISVLDAIKRKKQNTEDRFVFWLRNEGGPQFGGKSQSAVRYNEYKLLQNLPFEKVQMFNLEEDSLETTPLPLQGLSIIVLGEQSLAKHHLNRNLNHKIKLV